MKRRRLQGWFLGAAVAACVLGTGLGVSCIKTDSKVEFKPIYITMDVNIKVDRELDKFFDDLDTAGAKPAPEKK